MGNCIHVICYDMCGGKRKGTYCWRCKIISKLWPIYKWLRSKIPKFGFLSIVIPYLRVFGQKLFFNSFYVYVLIMLRKCQRFFFRFFSCKIWELQGSKVPKSSKKWQFWYNFTGKTAWTTGLIFRELLWLINIRT